MGDVAGNEVDEKKRMAARLEWMAKQTDKEARFARERCGSAFVGNVMQSLSATLRELVSHLLEQS